ncbi:MAG: hypothetical protein KAH32_08720, partial [Chlamydiia bacterium]|nr:hypothetical protein [Chlamydiia bacterium]
MSKSKNNVPGRPIPCTPYNQCTTGNTPSKMVIKSKLINGDIIVETQDGSVFRIEGAGSMDIMEAGGKAWREDVTYSYGDMVVYNDEIYLAMAKSRQCPPSEISDKWTVYQSGNGSGGTDGTDGRSTKILLFSTEDEFLALKPEVGDIAMAAVFIIFDRELVRTATRQILAGDTFMYDGVEWIYQGSLRGAVGEAGIPGSPGY